MIVEQHRVDIGVAIGSNEGIYSVNICHRRLDVGKLLKRFYDCGVEIFEEMGEVMKDFD